jgi:small conductance mechanosensitive channel
MADFFPNNWIWVVLTLASAVAGYLVLVFLLRRLLRSDGRPGRAPHLPDFLAEVDVGFSSRVGVVLGLTIAVIAILVSLALVGLDLGPAVNRLEGFGLVLANWLEVHGVRIVVVIVLGYLIYRAGVRAFPSIITAALTRDKEGTELEEASKRVSALAQVSQYAVTIIVIVVAFLMVMAEIGFNLAPVLAGLGIVGIALGFGAQSLVRDVISGIFILVEDQYGVGDVASIAGKTGVVEGINLRRTILRDLDGIVHSVPNGEVTVASNYSKSFSRVNLDVSVAYKEDLDHVFRVLNRVGMRLASDEYFGPLITEPPQVVRVDSFEDSGIAIKMIGVTKPIRQWEVTGELRRRIKQEFDREGIEIPFPHRTVYWREDAHPRSELETLVRGRPRSEAEELAPLELTYRDPWVKASVNGDSASEPDAPGVRPVKNLMANLDQVRQLLRHPPMGLFTDIDGTLAWIAPNPTFASVSTGVRQVLEELSQRMTVVILTGRDVASARSVLGLTSVVYLGNHGLESWEHGNVTAVPEAQPFKRRIRRLSRLAKDSFPSASGVFIEDKGFSLAFHFRRALDPAKARSEVLNFLSALPEARNLPIYKGKMVVEVHVPTESNKGTALKGVVESHGLKSALVLGDDSTDVDSFQMLARLREERFLLGISVAVLDSNTPSELSAVADYALPNTESVELFLRWLAEETREK